MPFYAKTLGDNYAKQVDKELRASHAGETGAVWIYLTSASVCVPKSRSVA